MAQKGFDVLREATDSRYRLSMVVGRRAAQLKKGVPSTLTGKPVPGTSNAVTEAMRELEASKISSRTKAGLERVRAQGKTLGRPDGFTLHGPTLAQMKAEGFSQGRMSRETGLAINTIKGYLKRLEG